MAQPRTPCTRSTSGETSILVMELSAGGATRTPRSTAHRRSVRCWRVPAKRPLPWPTCWVRHTCTRLTPCASGVQGPRLPSGEGSLALTETAHLEGLGQDSSGKRPQFFGVQVTFGTGRGRDRIALYDPLLSVSRCIETEKGPPSGHACF